jgi:aspartyl-tRNA(Asn)/glutamyl-tRNA(Gln) amidotransferase subunit A
LTTTTEPYFLAAHDAADLLARRALSSRELTQALIDRIDAVDGGVRAYLTRTSESALQQADAADALIRAGSAGPLTGVPMALKDVLVTKGVRTTCGSKMLANYVPPYSATVATKLADAGAVMLGKLNMDEFAMGSSTENSAFFPTANPWDLSRVPGGSSGGSAAAVAAGEALFTLGTDTGGSIRQPAALCGVVGVKPTYGRVSRFGLVAFASSLDQIGPFTHDVLDAALVLNAIGGHDACDSTSAPVAKPDFTAGLQDGIKGLRVGVPREYFAVEGMEEGVRRAVEDAIAQFRRLGAEVDESLSLPSTPHALAVYYIIAPSEASANLARYDGVKYGFSDHEGATMWENMERTREFGFGDEVKRRIMLGTYALSAGYYDAYYLKAQQVRTLIRREFDDAFSKFDVILAPTSPTVAFKLGAKTADPMAMYLNDIFTIPANIAGIPAMSLPCGFVDGLPVGLQIMAKPFDEATMLRAAFAYEREAGFVGAHPGL